MTKQGDDRTSNETIGQIQYADGQKGGTDKEARKVVEGGEEDQQSNRQQKIQGGAGSRRRSPLGPEKQGGTGGP